MTLPASIRVNVRAPFPSRVLGSSFISVAKANGVWTITPNYQVLNPGGAIASTQIVALQDTVTGLWSYVNAYALQSGGIFVNRIITVAGAVTVLPTDGVLVFNKSPSGASTVNLPLAATRNGSPVMIKDLTGDASTNNITIVPNGTETIDGFLAAAAALNGVALVDKDYASKWLVPITGGWYVL